MSNAHATEVASGRRFDFGKNWASFLATIDEDRIARAKESLCELLETSDLEGKRFLDIGSGSGLSSLVAFQLGAEVVSFDFDPMSVACTEELRRRFCSETDRWTVVEGSILDEPFVRSLGSFDIVHSWGVLHHTGDMYQALEHALIPLSEGGRCAIAIYNDQGKRSTFWHQVKKCYCGSTIGRILVLGVFIPYFFCVAVVSGLIRYGRPWARFTRYRQERGMSIYHDWIDWLGGLPFEVATPHAIDAWFQSRDFKLVNQKLTKRLGCNEFVFESVSTSIAS